MIRHIKPHQNGTKCHKLRFKPSQCRNLQLPAVGYGGQQACTSQQPVVSYAACRSLRRLSFLYGTGLLFYSGDFCSFKSAIAYGI
ncbi:hypothetical protein HanRHA438_Chr11g0491991 [Helianthus annuus]|nr:hypothetical protein HanRHA438_Chr11g0491991 [Helianthus annuus]